MPGSVVRPEDAHRDRGERRMAELERALAALVEGEAVVATWGGHAECAYCGGACHLDNPVEHAPDCPWLRAKALLAGTGEA